MHDAHDFLRNLAVILCVAALTTVAFQKLRQPVILGYLLAGVIVGPHVPVPLVVEQDFARTLSELGVVLLMFSLGLEFSLRKLLKVGLTAVLVAVIECSLMVWLGYVIGRAFGWTHLQSIFTGATIAISSTTIIARAFGERKEKGRYTELVFGVLIVEDLIAILLLAVLTTVATGKGLSAAGVGLLVGRLVVFLVGFVVAGLLVVPRLVRFVLRLHRPETTLVASMGLCFGMALLAQAFGYSVALGAFLGGSLVAESGHARRVEPLVEPVRDMFGAIFFVSVGMLIDPKLIWANIGAVGVLTLAVVVGKVVGVSLAAFLAGQGTRASVQTGMSLAQIGEFSFIIAGVGLALGATKSFLYPVAVAVSAVTTLLTPWFIRASGPVANLLDRKLPHSLQTFASLYGSWVEQLKEASPGSSAPLRRFVRLLLLDVGCVAGLLIGTSLFLRELQAGLVAATGLSPGGARWGVLAGAGVLAFPFLLGAARCARVLGEELSVQALPAARAGRLDLAAAPRRALAVTLQLAILVAVGLPFLALTQPFLPAFRGAAVLLAALAVLGLAFWRSTANLQGHVRAGAQVIADMLARQSREELAAERAGEAGERAGERAEEGTEEGAEGRDAGAGAGAGAGRTGRGLEAVHRVLPGLGDPVPLVLAAGSPAVGRTLADLNLRGLTGATVLALTREQGEVLVPTGKEVLQAGDRLALAGTHDAVEAARALLLSGALQEAGPRGA
jgi:CPA2 family monovalent cation:H+ antiporter-2